MHPNAVRILGTVATACALVSIAILLTASDASDAWAVLLACLGILGSCMVCTACAPAWRLGRLMPVPPIGVGCAVLAALALVACLVLEPRGDALPKATAVLYLVACAAAHLSVLSLATPVRTAGRAAGVAGVLFTALFIYGILGEPDWKEGYVRALAVTAVAVVTLDVLAWLGARVPRGAELPPGPAGAAAGRCPSCGAPITPSLPG